jgi:hypothetical protein
MSNHNPSKPKRSSKTVYLRVNTTDAKMERKESLERDREMRERIRKMMEG